MKENDKDLGSNSNIKVVIRTRPTPHFSTKNIMLDVMENKISINLPKSEDKGVINNQKESWTFNFDKIFHNVSQDDLFEFCAKDIIQKSIDGYNGTIFAYGQTGSGKTFTMSGTPSNYSYRGIIPRGITRVFQEIGNKPELDVQIKISYLEIYNETFFDLLSVVPSHNQKGDITINEDSKGNLIFKGLSIVSVQNEEEAFNLLFEGEANKTISEHHLNKESSRSHCIFTIHLEIKSRIESSDKVNTSKLNFVDLAGSERVKKTGSTGIVLKEANYINKSLTFLEQVVISLAEKSKTKKKVTKLSSGDHVPYRQSKLTHLLKDSIGGNCRTVMIATIIPELNHVHETLSSLNFARRMMSVENTASPNIQVDIYKQIIKQKKEIDDLKLELAMFDTLKNRGRIKYEPYSEKEKLEVQKKAYDFLTGKEEDIDFDSVRMAKELFIQCRNLFQRYSHVYVDEMDGGETKQVHIKQNSIYDNKQDFNQGSEIELQPSFGIGKANKNAKPVNKLEISQGQVYSDQEDDIKDNKLADSTIKQNLEDKQITTQYEGEIPDKNTAFNIFREQSKLAKEKEQDIAGLNFELNKKKEEAKEFLKDCNDLKDQIDEIKIKVNEKKLKFSLGDDNANIVDEEEMTYYRQLKDLREHYKEKLQLYKDAKSDINKIKQNIDLLKVSYVEAFENWFFKKFNIRVEDYELKIQKKRFGVNHEIDGENQIEIDQEEQAYFNAKKKIATISKARKQEKALKKNS